MNKILVSACALAALALTFASCNKNDEANPSNKNKSVELTINLPAFDSSMRLLGDKTNNGDYPKVQAGDVLTVIGHSGSDASSPRTNVTTVTLTPDLSPHTFKGTAAMMAGTTFIEVVAYDDNATLTKNVNTRQGDAKDGVKVRLIGGGAVVAGPPATCAVTIKPEMARIEVVGQLKPTGGAFANLAELKLHASYLNNIKTDRDAGALTRISTSLAVWNPAYTGAGTLFAMTQAYSPEITNTAIDFPGGKTCDGYNFFPQEPSVPIVPPLTKDNVSPVTPHFVFKVSYKTNAVGAVAVNDVYLNVVALKDKATSQYITKFEAGKVYQFDLKEIADLMDNLNPPVTPTPDPDQLSVELTVTVGDWTVVPVTPIV
ncbi:hypothetical protein [Porphyromonas loveana]|uniref:hypothetical protein n=1 Tax=Porphyromonas loveana TaxID=1884669 RepID=UPI00359FD204